MKNRQLTIQYCEARISLLHSWDRSYKTLRSKLGITHHYRNKL